MFFLSINILWKLNGFVSFQRYVKKSFGNGDILINHQNITKTIVKRDNEKIRISIFDATDTEMITIELNPNNQIKYSVKTGEEPPAPAIAYVEKCLEQNKIIYFYNNQKDDGMQICEIKKNIIKTGVVDNLFKGNFKNLNDIKNFKSMQFDLYPDFKNQKIKETKGQLSYIVENFGIPHSVINLTDGYQLLLYYGSHKCSNGCACGVVLIKINQVNQITGIYKMINVCNCSGGEKITTQEDTSYN